METLNIYCFVSSVCKTCGQSLGVDDGSILYKRITTSSTGNLFPIDKDSAWLQVDLQHKTLIQGVTTQGSSYRWNWVTEFLVSYSNNEQDWRFVGGTSWENGQVDAQHT